MTAPQEAGKTAAIFIDDGGLDAYEFASNYIWFDPQNPDESKRAWQMARKLHSERMNRLPGDAPYGIEAPRLVGEEPGLHDAHLLKSA